MFPSIGPQPSARSWSVAASVWEVWPASVPPLWMSDLASVLVGDFGRRMMGICQEHGYHDIMVTLWLCQT